MILKPEIKLVSKDRKKSIIGRYFRFEFLITPSYIKIFHALIFVVYSISAITGIVIATNQNGFTGFITAFLVSLVFGFISLLGLRIFCECILVFFKIYEELQDINDKDPDVDSARGKDVV